MDYLTYLFINSLNKSLKTLPLILAVLIIRKLLPQGQKRLRVWLWGIVGLSLMLPVWRIPNPFSLVPSAVPVSEKILYAAEPAIESGISVVNDLINPALGAAAYNSIENSCSPMQIVMAVSSLVWVTGIGLMLLYTVISTIRLHWRLRGAQKDASERRVYCSETVQTPFILGLFRPRIYMPANISEEINCSVLLHERAHIRRGDPLWKMLGFLLLCVYWYHPLIWYCFALLSRDIEFACDERVIRKLDAQEKKSYAEALLQCSLLPLQKSACPLAFGEVAVRSRIESVVNYQKTGIPKTVFACLTLPVLAFCFLTDPDGQQYIPDRAVFQRAILEETPAKTNTAYRFCDYVILEKGFEPFYDQRKISYQYSAVLVQEYSEQDGKLTLAAETFSPVFTWFKYDWLCCYWDLEQTMTLPYAEDMQNRTLYMMQTHLPQVDLSDESWRSYYDQLAASCAEQAAHAAN